MGIVYWATKAPVTLANCVLVFKASVDKNNSDSVVFLPIGSKQEG
jgi:hypothetical protein